MDSDTLQTENGSGDIATSLIMVTATDFPVCQKLYTLYTLSHLDLTTISQAKFTMITTLILHMTRYYPSHTTNK